MEFKKDIFIYKVPWAMQFPIDWFSLNYALNVEVWLLYYKYPSLRVSGMQEIA